MNVSEDEELERHLTHMFRDAEKREVRSLDFIEIKTGKARLNEHEKAVKEAVEGGKVEYRVIK